MKRIMTSLLLFLFAFWTGAAVHAQDIERETLNNEVNSLYKQGCYGRAVVVAKKALAVAEEAVGRDHPDVALSLNGREISH